ncbi:MAG: hypothetical protein HC927_12150 [Deltaproteobacteria bacterium]|nr:hypothetical protein [Deltaproteobacteria bacterium]
MVALLVAALVPALACSNPAKDPPPECVTDEDCDEDLVCSTEQICVLQLQPPLPVLGFDIREGAFQIELTGCDPEVILEAGGIELRVQRRELLARNFELSVSTERSVAACVECTGECDDDELICVEPQTAQLDLTQASRFERERSSTPAAQLHGPGRAAAGGRAADPRHDQLAGYEADDLIGALCEDVIRWQGRARVLTTDKDLCQLVREDGRVGTRPSPSLLTPPRVWFDNRPRPPMREPRWAACRRRLS